MHLEEFADGTTVLHRLDPRIKFLTGFPLVVAVALLKGTMGPGVGVGLGILLAIMGKLSAGKLLIRLAAVNAFILMLWVMLPFVQPGQSAFSLGPLTASYEGMAQALSITLRTNAIALISIAVLGTSEAMSLAHALVHLRVPGKLVHLFFFFYRYLSVLHGEYSRMRGAMLLRSFKARNTMHTYRSLAHLAGMLLVRSHDRAGRIYNAMLCRGFRGHFPVTSHFHYHASDILMGAAGIITTAGLLIIWY